MIGNLVGHPARPSGLDGRPAFERVSSSLSPSTVRNRSMILVPLEGGGEAVSQAVLGEFDPGSGRTLAACLTHASRAERPLRGYSSGERVSNT